MFQFVFVLTLQGLSDYFPVDTGNKWSFVADDGERLHVKFDRMTTYRNRDLGLKVECNVLKFYSSQYSEEYYLKEKPTVGLVLYRRELKTKSYKSINEFPVGLMFFPYFIDSSNEWTTSLSDRNDNVYKFSTVYMDNGSYEYEDVMYDSVAVRRSVEVNGEVKEDIYIIFIRGVGPVKIERVFGERKESWYLDDYYVRKKIKTTNEMNTSNNVASYIRDALDFASDNGDIVLQQVILSIIATFYRELFTDIEVEKQLVDLYSKISSNSNFSRIPSYEKLIKKLSGYDEILVFKKELGFREYCDALMVKYIPDFSRTIHVLNSFRLKSGLKPVVFSALSAKGCMYHCFYLNEKGYQSLTKLLDYHTEDPAYEYYTDEGNEAAKRSVISGFGLPRSVESWIGTFYHRIPLLRPDAISVGIGLYNETSGYVIPTCIQTVTGSDYSPSENSVVIYPSDGLDDVPVAFSGDEMPKPVPGVDEKTLGFPITVTFYGVRKVVVRRAELYQGKNRVSSFLHTPENPSNPERADKNTICILPKKWLKKGTEYTVFIECDLDGRNFVKEWTFTTSR